MITFLKEPSGIYPAYNDSFVEFSSDLADNNKVEVTAYPFELFRKKFVLYSDSEGRYLFNVKEIVRVVFNQNGFEDVEFNSVAYWGSIEGLYLLQGLNFKVFSDVDEEEVYKEYEFFKAVKQIGEFIFSNPFQLLSDSDDGINFSLTYFEGFPFAFDVQKIEEDSVVVLKNKNTGNQTEEIQVSESGAFRFVVDRGSGNWTNDGKLPLISGLNNIEIFEGGNFKTNISLKKKKVSSGVYLRWFNGSGGFSYFLFDRFYSSGLKSKESGRVYNNEFKNINEATGSYKSTGKEASGSLSLKASYDFEEYGVLKSLLTSPLIQMYTSDKAFVEGRFIDVFVEGSISFNNKKAKNEFNILVDLPEVLTVKL